MNNILSFDNKHLSIGQEVYQISIDINKNPKLISSTVEYVVDLNNIIIENNGKSVIVNPKGVHTNKMELLKIWIDQLTESLQNIIPKQLNQLLAQYKDIGGIVPENLREFEISSSAEI